MEYPLWRQTSERSTHNFGLWVFWGLWHWFPHCFLHGIWTWFWPWGSGDFWLFYRVISSNSVRGLQGLWRLQEVKYKVGETSFKIPLEGQLSNKWEGGREAAFRNSILPKKAIKGHKDRKSNLYSNQFPTQNQQKSLVWILALKLKSTEEIYFWHQN